MNDALRSVRQESERTRLRLARARRGPVARDTIPRHNEAGRV